MRFRAPLTLLLLLCSAVASAAAATGPDIRDTRLLSEPAISADRIAFIYANDLWTCALDGSNVRRLTSDVGVESSPVFSPDGKWIAFSAQYEGNTDVYVVASDGGVPRRLTWHPGNDIANGFTADSRSVLLTSPRNVHTARYTQLFTVPVEGGPEQPLPIPHADRATYSPDGKRIAYNPLSPRFLQWKRYRGGTVSQVWLYDAATHAIEKIPQPQTRVNDAGPMWIGDTVYFRSDRESEFNLWSYDTRSKALRRLTNHSDFPVANASAGGGKIVYEQAGYLHVLDPASGSARKLAVGVAADLPETRPRFVKETKDRKYIREVSLSPSAVRVALNFRGEIVTVPAEKGDVRNLTNTTAWHERSPVWSPDGRRIAYFSDESGEYELHIAGQDGKGEPKKFKLTGAGFYEFPAWSPDSRKIAYVDNSRTLWWIDAATGVSKKVANDHFYGPVKNLWPAWSPDSRWIAYSLNNAAYIQRVHVYSIDQDKTFPVTDGLSDATDPVFDKSGKYLYFFASTDAGPVNNWFTLQDSQLSVTKSIWLAVLNKSLPNPLVKESDEEKAAAEEEAKKSSGTTTRTRRRRPAATRPTRSPTRSRRRRRRSIRVKIDFDGLEYRILDLPIPTADLENLQAGDDGQIFFIRTADEKRALQRFDLKDRKTETLLPDVADYQISADRKKVLYKVKDDWAIASTSGKKVDTSEAKTLKTAAIEVKVEPRVRVAGDVQRGVAHQPRLLLRPEHARRELGRDARAVRAVPPARRRPAGPEPRDPLDALGALRRSQLHHELRRHRRDEERPGRTPRRRLRDRERAVPVQARLRRSQLEPGAALAAHRARREREGGRVPDRCRRPGRQAAGEPVQLLREHVRQADRDHRRPERGRQGRAHGQRRAGRERERPAQPRLGRGKPAQGGRRDGRQGRLRLRAQHRGRRVHVLPALLLSAVVQAGGDPRRALQRRRLARRLLHRRHPEEADRLLGDALRAGHEDAVGVDPGPARSHPGRDRRLGRRPAAVDVAQVRGRPDRRHAHVGRPRRHPRAIRRSWTAA